MLGGIWGEARKLYTEGDYGAFEQDVDYLIGDKLRNSREASEDFWGALANVDWFNKYKGYEVGYSFRAAGDLIAAIHRKGDYMDWYCSGPAGVVQGWIEEALATRGWTFEEL